MADEEWSGIEGGAAGLRRQARSVASPTSDGQRASIPQPTEL